MKHGVGSIVLWGYFSSVVTGATVKREGIMDRAKSQFIPSSQLKTKKNFTFQNINDLKHTSKSTK